MCGVVGYLGNFLDTIVSRDRLLAATNSMAYRGPDDFGVWQSENRRAGLGHRRLTTCGDHESRQPVSSIDERVVAVVNGELYDPGDQLRYDLIRRGCHFKTNGDSELVVHLYEQFGLRFVDLLRGEFAIVLFDAVNQEMIAVRDRFGIKPLVYHQTANEFWFASQPRAIEAAGIDLQRDEESAWHTMSFQYTLPDRTLHHNVFQLEPGMIARVKAGRFSLQRYWNLDLPCKGEPSNDASSDTDLVKEFSTRLDEAVAIRRRGEQPIVCHLSGGIDSGSILQSASVAGPVAAAFTVAFPDEQDYDEESLAVEMSRCVGVPLTTINGGHERLVDAMQAAIQRTQCWTVNGHLPAKYLLSQAIAESGYKVAFTGEGADELLSGYSHLFLDFVSSKNETPRSRSRWQRKLDHINPNSLGTMLPTGSQLDTSAFGARLGYVPTFVRAKASLGSLMQGFLRDDFQRTFAGRDAFAQWSDHHWQIDQIRDRSPLQVSKYLWCKTALAQNILRTLGDGCEAAWGTEGRVPMLDHQLFDWAKHLPNRMLFAFTETKRGFTEKTILRQAMRKRLPGNIVDRPKHPFDAPPLGSSVVASKIVRERIETAVVDHPYFDPIKVQKLIQRLPSLDRNGLRVVDPLWWMLLSSHPDNQ